MRCTHCKRISRMLMRQNVRKSIEAMSSGVSICPLAASTLANGRHSSAPTTIARGIDRVFIVCFDSAIFYFLSLKNLNIRSIARSRSASSNIVS